MDLPSVNTPYGVENVWTKELAAQSSFKEHFNTEHNIQVEVKNCRDFLQKVAPKHPAILELFDAASQQWLERFEATEGAFNVHKLLEAVIFAAIKHEGQFRKDPNQTPYIIHPIGVAHVLWENGIYDEQTLVTALLHDTLEDTSTTAEEIEFLFGRTVLTAVQELTNDPNLSSQENKQRQIDHAPEMGKQARLVKLADRFYNLNDLLHSTPLNWSREQIDIYFDWGKKLHKALSGTHPVLERSLAGIIRLYETSQRETEDLPAIEVGELGGKWVFPSDHLPVGATVNDFHVASWNVLNSHWISWIEKNGQGLAASLIMQEHQYINDAGLTLRDQHIVQDILKMLKHPTHPRSILGLQECSPAFIEELKAQLPPHILIVYSSITPVKDQDILLYNTRLFQVVPEGTFIAEQGYPSAPGRQIMDLVLLHKGTGQQFRLINAHVPGDPALSCRDEFARYVISSHSNLPMIVMGDMNANIIQMQEAFDLATKEHLKENPFLNCFSYYTHIGTHREAKVIDHILVDMSHPGVTALPNEPEEVLPGLQKIVDVMRGEIPFRN